MPMHDTRGVTDRTVSVIRWLGRPGPASQPQGGHSLQCFSCFDECVDKTTTTCGPGAQCMIRDTWLGAGRKSRQKDCLDAQRCIMHSNDRSSIQWCCDTDLCNADFPRTTPATTSPPMTTGTNMTTTLGVPLKCYTCSALCLVKSETTCNAQEVCSTNTAQFGGVNFNSRGCANTSICSTVTNQNVAGTNMAIKHECCNTNLCNSGNRHSAIHRGFPAVVLAAVLAVWTAMTP
ncbi:uncharacterized protein LOC134949482 isoform X2 [Pseudophryne corroboree]|uniref:uncharacterized protein LOC134949482 isoform X2 n=1 Tax=Pseudophryne corroboree TaxID=495146 RepID=UPI00308199CE